MRNRRFASPILLVALLAAGLTLSLTAPNADPVVHHPQEVHSWAHAPAYRSIGSPQILEDYSVMKYLQAEQQAARQRTAETAAAMIESRAFAQTPAVSTPSSGTGSAYAEWTRVAVCEEGGWIGSSGSAYPDSLGITAANWYRFGGGSDVSPIAQIAVAQRLAAHYGIAVPDQNGCAGSW